jgi:hypothetical protein
VQFDIPTPLPHGPTTHTVSMPPHPPETLTASMSAHIQITLHVKYINAVVWQNGQSWVGIKNHMGYNQEAYDAECAALARALEEAAKRQTVPERVTIFTDAQAAIRRMVSEDPVRARSTQS